MASLVHVVCESLNWVITAFLEAIMPREEEAEGVGEVLQISIDRDNRKNLQRKPQKNPWTMI